jgi:hypothetical protein
VIPLQPVAPDPDFRAGQKRMHFVKDKIERDGLNLVVRRAKPDIVEGAAAARFVLKGELVIGNRPRDAAGERLSLGLLEPLLPTEKGVRLLGISLSSLTHANVTGHHQLSLVL